MCELQRTACVSNRPIEIKFQGLCGKNHVQQEHDNNDLSTRALLFKSNADPCATMECPTPSVCVLDSDRKAQCRCGSQCPSDFQPVCGSDGRSYSSQCHLLQEACRTQRNLRILYKGLCESGKRFRCCGVSFHYEPLSFTVGDAC